MNRRHGAVPHGVVQELRSRSPTVSVGRPSPVCRIVSRAAAIAVNEDGHRQALGVCTSPSGAELFRMDFLRALADRGLRGVQLVVADDHKGLRAAARRVFDAAHRRCRVHWMRTALADAPAKRRTAVAAMLKAIFAQETRTDAEAQRNAVADAASARSTRSSAP